MVIDCHLHTTRYSPCSNLSPYEACSISHKRGLDSIVITEHQIQWNKKEIKELQRDFPGIKIYSGLEVTLREGIDLVIITKNLGLNIPFMISFNELLELKEFDIQNSFVFVAHLFRWNKELSHEIEKIFPHIHGIEMNSINILLSGHKKDPEGRFHPRDLPLYKRVQKKWNLRPMFNTDSHNSLVAGSIANNIKTTHIPDDEEELVSVLKKNIPLEFQHSNILKDILNRF